MLNGDSQDSGGSSGDSQQDQAARQRYRARSIRPLRVYAQFPKDVAEVIEMWDELPAPGDWEGEVRFRDWCLVAVACGAVGFWVRKKGMQIKGEGD
jgi:hypothetical protein